MASLAQLVERLPYTQNVGSSNLSRSTKRIVDRCIMLHIIKTITDSLFYFIKDDPVRPSIPEEVRIGENKDVFVLREDDQVKSILCVSYQNNIPTNESELFELCETPSVAIFYTVWSYSPGAGRTLIFDTVDHIEKNFPNIKRFVTLSPKTEMARKFHLKNGAVIFRENNETVNYEYVRLPIQ